MVFSRPRFSTVAIPCAVNADMFVLSILNTQVSPDMVQESGPFEAEFGETAPGTGFGFAEGAGGTVVGALGCGVDAAVALGVDAADALAVGGADALAVAGAFGFTVAAAEGDGVGVPDLIPPLISITT